MYNIERGIAIIKEFEGCKLTAYKCPSGVWTIGYGHTANVKEGDKITRSQADIMLYDDVLLFAEKLESAIAKKGLRFNENQFNALLSFVYNCGMGNFNKLVKDRTNEEIGNALLLYNKANGRALRGLTRRRQTEHDLYFESAMQTEKIVLSNIGFKVRDNYRIRTAPNASAQVIAWTDSTKKATYTVHGKCNDYILTDKGFIHKDAFYATF